jgi:uncharacterized protein YegP (UPF0339 family)
MKFQLYSSGGQYRWRLLAANNRIVADSGEAYLNKSDCISAIALVKGSFNAPISDLT